MPLRVDAKSDNPKVGKTFLWIQFGVALFLNGSFLIAFLLYKYNSDFHNFIVGRS